jgi:hypothetical protein
MMVIDHNKTKWIFLNKGSIEKKGYKELENKNNQLLIRKNYLTDVFNNSLAGTCLILPSSSAITKFSLLAALSTTSLRTNIADFKSLSNGLLIGLDSYMDKYKKIRIRNTGRIGSASDDRI